MPAASPFLAILQEPGYVSLEGYIDANVLIGALQRDVPRLDTEQLVGTLENLRDLDVGLGSPANFTGSEYQLGHTTRFERPPSATRPAVGAAIELANCRFDHHSRAVFCIL